MSSPLVQETPVAHAAPRSARDEAPTAAQSKRLVSIDVLRGFDMLWIIGGAEAFLALVALFVSPLPEWLTNQFDHVEWEGFVAWDLIMPLFLFVSGASMPFSFSKWAKGGGDRKGLYLRLARRLALLWILGMMVQGNLLAFDLERLALYSNTLQAIAAGYLVAAVLLLTAGVRAQVAVTAALLLGYWAILALAPIPGEGAGILEPWRNFALHADKILLGEFRDGTTYTWTISSMGFAATVMQGVFAGHLLRSRLSESRKTLALLGLGAASLALGWAWSYWLPIIKHIWTSSMVLWAGGWCYLLLGAFYWVLDVKGWRRGAFPLAVIGMNAIAVYVATHLVSFRHIAEGLVGGAAARLGAAGEFLLAFTTLLIPWLILLYMYRKKTFIRI